MLSVEPMYEHAQKEQKDAARGEISLFSLIAEEKDPFETPPEIIEPTPKERLLLREKELLGFYLTGHPLERYQPLMKRLSCVSLSELSDRLVAGIIRAAFVVEALSFKIASRSGRKFAILTISDGAGCFELPIWPDLYEEKPDLLQENQLLYAVLEVTPDDGEIKLQCRWFDDLTKADEKMVKACDDGYDRAQSGLKLSAMRKGRGTAAKKKKEETKAEVVHLKLDVAKVRLSHILELKNIFRTYPGKSPLHLAFWAGESHHGDLTIDATWGVEYSLELKEKLDSHPVVVKNWTEINS
ncbi:MAG: hypothetical protein K940chlam2_01805, partial [Chlamydiae bacterium]|nr:hypothetical protein [Chlamydiota bacterium]